MAIRTSSRWTLGRRLRRAAIVLLLASLLLQPGASFSYAAAIPQPISPADQAQTDALSDPPLGIPAFQWSQIPGASLYRIEISQNLEFSPLLFSAITAYNRYTPILGTDSAWADGLYYWRVRVEEPRGAFSPPFRFTKAWAAGSTPTLLSPAPGQTLTFFDAPDFSWTSVTGAAQYRFQIAATPANFNNPVYQADLLATSHQPEYAIFVKQVGGVIDKYNTWVFNWEGSGWSYGSALSSLSGGDVSSSGGYVELQIPATAIGMNTNTYSASVMLFSVNTTTNAVQDSVPADPQAPGSGYLTRFTSLSDHINLLYPPSNSGGDNVEVPSFVPFAWDYATGNDGANPFAGARVNICLDEACTTVPGYYELVSDTPYFAMPNVAFLNDLSGDTTYYWRVMQRYLILGQGYYESAWTSGASFERTGFVAQNLQTSVDFATPVFSWDMVEGAASYDLIVATDASLQNGIVLSVNTTMNQYVPTFTLYENNYYWSVRVRRFGGVTNDWAPVANFTLSRPRPSGLTINDADNNVHYAPTMCWNHLIGYANSQPVMAAYRYRIQIAYNAEFSPAYIWDTVETEQTCYTSPRSMPDTTLYWRVQMIDAYNATGNYSDYAFFTKQYPVTTLVSPLGGSSGTPTYKWTAVDGAASYRVEVSTNPNFSYIIDQAETVNIQYTPLFTYTNVSMFYWRVAIRDRDGRLGPYTDAILIGDVYRINIPMLVKK